MDPKAINNYNDFKISFSNEFKKIRDDLPSFKSFLFELLIYDTAFIVGGFLRDVIYNTKPRDLDILTTTSHANLLNIIKKNKLNYSINRHKGIKITFENLIVDIWSIQNNWAFYSEVVRLNENDMLESIANGCFYNYDSLVINVHNLNLNVRHYNNWVDSRSLDIIQKKIIYREKNPTPEANILRALYISKKYNTNISDICKQYIKVNLGRIEYKYGDALSGLNFFLAKYPKYADILNEENLVVFLNEFQMEIMARNKNHLLNLYKFKF